MPAPVLRLRTLAWYPTFRCPYACSFCNSRSLPQFAHGEEATAEEWIAAFQSLSPAPELLMVTGGEPAAYEGLGAVLDAISWQVHINTNLAIDPSRWLTEGLAERMACISTCCQWHPADPRALKYWERLQALRQRLPRRCVVNSHLIATHHLPVKALRLYEAKCRECGVAFGVAAEDHHWKYRQAVPVRNGERMCTGGATMLAVMPDGAAFRCLGHAYACAESDVLGNVLAQGWGILPTGRTPCKVCACTRVAVCDTVEYEIVSGSDEHRWTMQDWKEREGESA